MKRLVMGAAAIAVLAAMALPASAKVPPGLDTIPLTSISCPGLTVTSVVASPSGNSFYLMPSGDHYVLTYISVTGTFTPTGSTTPIPFTFEHSYGKKTGKLPEITCTFTEAGVDPEGSFSASGTVRGVKLP